MLIGDRQALSGVPAAPAGTGQISLCPGVQVMMSVVLRGGLTSADENALHAAACKKRAQFFRRAQIAVAAFIFKAEVTQAIFL